MVLCTGYLHHYPHLADDLRYNGPGTLYPDLYKAWLPDGYSQIFRLYAFGPLGLKDYGSATLRCKM